MKKTGKIQAVVFDVDGTLYPNYKMHLISLLFFIIHPVLSISFKKIRKQIRNISHVDNLHEKQAELLAEELEIDFNRAVELLDKYIYRQFVSMFSWIKPFKSLRAVLDIFKQENLKLGIISDFPVTGKLSYLGLDNYWDKVVSADEMGVLKPSPEAFLFMAKKLGLKPEEIIYVGNHYLYDIIGAGNAGMITAHFSWWKKKNSKADFTFNNYKKLQGFVLKHINS